MECPLGIESAVRVCIAFWVGIQSVAHAEAWQIEIIRDLEHKYEEDWVLACRNINMGVLGQKMWGDTLMNSRFRFNQNRDNQLVAQIISAKLTVSFP